MAKTKGEKSEKSSKKTGVGVPEGFIPVTSAGGQAWFKPEDMQTVYGELLGRFRRKTSIDKSKEPGHFYQIMLEQNCIGHIGSGDEAEEVDLAPGQIINVDERAALEDLAVLVESGKRWRVYIEPVEKVKVRNSPNMVWNFNVGKQEITSKNEPKVKPISAPVDETNFDPDKL